MPIGGKRVPHMVPIVAPRRGVNIAKEVREFLNSLVERWNEGDLEGFLDGYAEDAVIILGPKETIRGLEAIRKHYHQACPDPSAMGNLSLEMEDVRPVANMGVWMSASVEAIWTCDGRPASSLLVLHHGRGPREWKIVQEK